MPFKSRDQQKYLYATKPEVAKKFAEHAGKKKSLPKKVKKVKNSTKKK